MPLIHKETAVTARGADDGGRCPEACKTVRERGGAAIQGRKFAAPCSDRAGGSMQTPGSVDARDEMIATARLAPRLGGCAAGLAAFNSAGSAEFL